MTDPRGSAESRVGEVTPAGTEPGARSAVHRLDANLTTMPNGCIEWTGYRDKAGYGHLHRGGTMSDTERLLAEIAERRSDEEFMARVRAQVAADKPLLDRLAGDQSKLYRLSWEMVDQRELWRYCSSDPNYYSNVRQTVPNRQVPDEHWHPLSRMTDNPWQQFNQLREWADADREFVRNVRLEAVTAESVEE